MIFNGDFDESWTEGETRQSKLVFIGKNLDHAELKAAFAACAVTDELRTKKIKSLRFGVGDSVACNTGGSFQKGTVISQMYREEGMPPAVPDLFADGALIDGRGPSSMRGLRCRRTSSWR